MPFEGNQSYQVEEPNRDISRAALAVAQQAQAIADSALALANHALTVANDKLSGFITAESTYNGPCQGQLTSVTNANPAGPSIALSHGVLYSGGFPTVYLQDGAGDQISQKETEFNTRQGTKNVFIWSTYTLFGISPGTDGSAVLQGTNNFGNFLTISQTDLFTPQKDQVP